LPKTSVAIASISKSSPKLTKIGDFKTSPKPGLVEEKNHEKAEAKSS